MQGYKSKKFISSYFVVYVVAIIKYMKGDRKTKLPSAKAFGEKEKEEEDEEELGETQPEPIEEGIFEKSICCQSQTQSAL